MAYIKMAMASEPVWLCCGHRWRKVGCTYISSTSSRLQ